MLKKIKIQNFQSHKLSELNLSSGINVIVGESNHGKTAIIRLLNWIINNYNYRQMRSWWALEKEKGRGKEYPTYGEITTEEGNVITRLKSKSDNMYSINGEELRAFGTGVPEEVSNHLRIGDINMQKQMDAPFLLGLRAGDVARFLNKIANLDDIDRSTKRIKELSTNNKTDIKYAETEYNQKMAELKDYKYLDDAEAELSDLEKQYNIIQATQVQSIKLTQLCAEIREAQTKMNKILPDEEAIAEKLEQFNTVKDKIKTLQDQYNSIQSIIIDIKRQQRLIITKENEIKSIEKQLKELIPEACPMCKGTGKVKL